MEVERGAAAPQMQTRHVVRSKPTEPDPGALHRRGAPFADTTAGTVAAIAGTIRQPPSLGKARRQRPCGHELRWCPALNGTRERLSPELVHRILVLIEDPGLRHLPVGDMDDMSVAVVELLAVFLR